MTGAGVQVQIDALGLDDLQRLLSRMSNPQLDKLLASIGAEVESQTKLRISDDKSAPSGQAWAPWSAAYAKTRRGSQSLLQSQGALMDSIQYAVKGDGVEVGSNLIYAAIHQFGGAGVGRPGLPARPYLGLSPRDEQDIVKLVQKQLAKLFGSSSSSGPSSPPAKSSGKAPRAPNRRGRDERGRFLPRSKT